MDTERKNKSFILSRQWRDGSKDFSWSNAPTDRNDNNYSEAIRMQLTYRGVNYNYNLPTVKPKYTQ